MPGIVTNQLAQSAQGQAQQEGLQSQLYQQNLMNEVLAQYLGLAQNPTAQANNVNFMAGSPTGQGGGLYGNLADQMNAVAGTVPGATGSVDPAIMNMVLGNFQPQELTNASTLYYNALKNALGVNVPTVGSQNQMQVGGQTASSFASGVGTGMGNAAAGGSSSGFPAPTPGYTAGYGVNDMQPLMT